MDRIGQSVDNLSLHRWALDCGALCMEPGDGARSSRQGDHGAWLEAFVRVLVVYWGDGTCLHTQQMFSEHCRSWW